jgi:DNA (cytosine-5)-methyltransferase 1
MVNEAVGKALQASGLIISFKTEQDLGTGLTRYSDLKCETATGVVRVELMWRAKTSRAEIANYALVKLYNYGQAIGFLGEAS